MPFAVCTQVGPRKCIRWRCTLAQPG